MCESASSVNLLKMWTLGRRRAGGGGDRMVLAPLAVLVATLNVLAAQSLSKYWKGGLVGWLLSI